MDEFKIKYDHGGAKKILEILGAEFIKEEALIDFYLLDAHKDVWKLSKVGGTIKLVHLVNEGNCFSTALETELDDAARYEVDRFLNENNKVMRKVRRHYKWRKSKIVLDSISNLGEFVELYPINEEDKQNLFAAFNIQPPDLIKISYNALRAQK